MLNIAFVLAQVVFSGTRPAAPPRCAEAPPCSAELPAGTACLTVAQPAVLPPCGPDVASGNPCVWNGYEIVLVGRSGHSSRASIIFGPIPPFPGNQPIRGGYVYARLDLGPDDCEVQGTFRDIFEGALHLGRLPCWE